LLIQEQKQKYKIVFIFDSNISSLKTSTGVFLVYFVHPFDVSKITFYIWQNKSPFDFPFENKHQNVCL